MCLRQVSKDLGSHPTPQRLRAQGPRGGGGLQGRGWLALSTSSAQGKPQHCKPWRKWHCPQPGVWPSQDGKEGAQRRGQGTGKGGRGGGGRGPPSWPQNTASRHFLSLSHWTWALPKSPHVMPQPPRPQPHSEGGGRGQGRREEATKTQTARLGTSPQPGAGPVASVNRFQNH